MCITGPKEIDQDTEATNSFTYALAAHQVAHGLHMSIENPKDSLFWRLEETKAVIGTAQEPRNPGIHEPRNPGVQKAAFGNMKNEHGDQTTHNISIQKHELVGPN